MQRPVDVVEGGQPLAGPRPAHDDPLPETPEVVGVQRLAEAEHDVVRDVDGQGDRPHPGLDEAAPHPGRGRGGDVEATHHPGMEPVAAQPAADRGVVDELDRIAGGRGGGTASASAATGSVKAAPVACEYSRATPRTEKQ